MDAELPLPDHMCRSGHHDWTNWIWAGKILNPESHLYRRRCQKPGCRGMQEENQ